MSQETIIFALLLVPSLIIAIVFHEVAHGWVANALGDSTAKDKGRLTLNPFRHVDPVGTLLVPGGLALVGAPIFGWAKPVPVNQARLNNPRYGMMAVAAAGPGTNIILALIGAVLLGLAAIDGSGRPSELTEWALTSLHYFMLINIFLALFNLLPIPPFDGSHILEGLLPRSAARGYEKLRPLGMIFIAIIIGVSWGFPELGLLDKILLPPVEWAMGHLMGVAESVAGG